VVERVDLKALENLITRHFEATGSPRAKWILENWASMAPKFIKVFPHEYKRVLGVPRLFLQPTTHHLPPAPRSAAEPTEVARG
jgi:hypothetical protein